jgi:hypothetical protein
MAHRYNANIMTRNLPFLFVTLLPFLVAADAPSTQPATAPVVDDSTPIAFLHSSGSILPAGGYTAALGLFTTRDNQERKVADVLANYSLAVSRTEVTVRNKWGAAGDDSFVHSLGEKTDTDIDQAEIEAHDDHAIVIFKGEEATPTVLIRVDGHWKVDTGEAIKQTQKQGTVESWLKYSNDVIALLKKVDDNLAAGKYSSAADLCKETSAGITRIINSAAPM